MKRHTLAILLLLTATSCPSTNPVLTRRYAEIEVGEAAPEGLIELVAGVTATTPAAARQPIVLQLSDHGQAAYIARAGKPDSDLATELAKNFPATTSANATRTRRQTVLVVTHHTNHGFEFGEDDAVSDADRIASLEISLSAPEGAPYKFDGFNRFETVYGSVALGEISRKATRTFNAKLEPTFSGTLAGVGEAGGSSEVETEETLELRERIVQLSGWLLDKRGAIIQQGAVGLDLEGNTTINLVLELGGDIVELFSFSGPFKDGLPMDAAKLKPSIVRTRIPFFPTAAAAAAGPKGISVNVKTAYRFRHVLDGQDTTMEGDDHVVEYRGHSDVETAKIMDNEAFQALCGFWVLGVVQPGDDGAIKSQFMDNEGQASVTELGLERHGESRTLYVGTKQEAQDLLRWLKTSNQTAPIKVGSGADAWTLRLGPHTLSAGQIASLQVVEYVHTLEGGSKEPLDATKSL